MSEQLTDWFPSGTTPARIGAYEVPSHNPALYRQFQYWNGKTWGGWALSAEDALYNARTPSSRQNPQWRGLAKEPK